MVMVKPPPGLEARLNSCEGDVRSDTGHTLTDAVVFVVVHFEWIVCFSLLR